MSSDEPPRVNLHVLVGSSAMGRVKDFRELGRKGPGKKARKQGLPDVPLSLINQSTESTGKVHKKLGGKIRQRNRMRLLALASKGSTLGSTKTVEVPSVISGDTQKEQADENGLIVEEGSSIGDESKQLPV